MKKIDAMTTLANTNMGGLYFGYKILTRITAELTFTSLHQLLLQLKANVNSAPTTLGGRAHGYVGIILPPTYTTLALMALFLIPAHPAPLTINLPATQDKIALAKLVHDEALKAFQAYQLI